MKKILSLALSLLICVATALPLSVSAAPPTSSGTTPPPTSSGTTPPPNSSGSTPPPMTESVFVPAELYVKSLETKIFPAGDLQDFRFVISSRGDAATDVRITVDGSSPALPTGTDGTGSGGENYFTLQNDKGYITKDIISGDTEISSLLKISPNAKDGAYNLKFKMTCTESNGTKGEYTDTYTVYIQSTSENSPHITKTAFDKKEIGKENKAKLAVTISNPTNYDMNKVRVTLNADSKDFTLYENFQPVELGKIGGLDKKIATFSIYVPTSVATGNYPASFTVSYTDTYGIVTQFTNTVYVQVTRSADATAEGTTGTPRIIVSGYKTDTQNIKAGQTFMLDFTLQNTSAFPVSNMKIVMGSAQSTPTAGTTTSSGDVFFPAEGSNSFFVKSLGAGQSVTEKIKLMARQDVQPGVYPVMLDLEYEDKSAKPFKSQENISFPVSQEQRLDMVGLSLPTDGMNGSPIPVNFQYINKGKATIYNMSVVVEGDFTVEGGDVYVGNLVAGFNDYFDSSIIPTKDGENKGAIVLKYEDEKGTALEKRHEFSINIMPMDTSAMGNMGGTMEPSLPEGITIDPMTGEVKGGHMDPMTGEWVVDKKFNPIVLIAIIGGVVIVAGGITTFMIIRKKRKAKKEMMLNEKD